MPNTKVRDYLTKVSEDHGPNPHLLDRTGANVLGVTDSRHAFYIRNFLVSCVARAVKPGVSLRSFLIFQGDQGTGKSSLIQRLCPTPDLYCLWPAGEPASNPPYRSWICELEGVTPQDIGDLAGFATDGSDVTRPRYKKDARIILRPFAMVGTSNHPGVMPSAIPDVQIHVVPVGPAIDLDWLEEWRDRIWAAAYHAFLFGETP